MSSVAFSPAQSTAKTLQEWDIFPEIGEAIQRAGNHWHWIFGPRVSEVGSDGTGQIRNCNIRANCLLLKSTEHEASIVTILVVKFRAFLWTFADLRWRGAMLQSSA